jgi:carbon-monoxide dehydrogenase medium subunit
MKAAPFDYLRCADAAQALALLAQSVAGDGMAKVCAGSQSLGPMLNLRLAQPTQLLDVSRIGALCGFSLQDDVLRIGAAVTHARIEDGELPDISAGFLPAVAAGIAYRAVRNRGTLGGSLAHADPSADWVTAMSLLDARFVLLGAGGERRLAATSFFEGPFTTALQADELLVAVEVRRFSAGARWAYRKVCRKPGEFADAIAALWFDPAHGVARAALGALDGMPHVVEGLAAVEALRQPAGVAELLDRLGIDDPHARALHSAMLRRAFIDLEPCA